MESVGQKLKKNRELKKLKITAISKELKISEKLLIDFENDQIQSNINIVYLIGHLKSYCIFLGLDHIHLIEEYKTFWSVKLVNLTVILRNC